MLCATLSKPAVDFVRKMCGNNVQMRGVVTVRGSNVWKVKDQVMSVSQVTVGT